MVSLLRGGDPASLVVWLLSDVLLRDKRLRYSAQLDDLQETLSLLLDVTLQEREKKDLLSSLTRPHRTESWQKSWGLPRPSLVGLAAGTCVVYDVVGTLDPQRLADLEVTGIGDRCVEGYGQICFNHPLLSQKEFTVNAASPTKPELPEFKPIFPPDPIYEYATIVEQAAWLEAIRKQAIALAADENKRESLLGLTITGTPPISQPSLTQLGTFRSVLLKLQYPQDNGETPVLTWLKNAHGKVKWSEKSFQLAKELVTNVQKVWQFLDLRYEALTLTQGGEENLKRDLWVEAVQVAIDACIRSHKRAWEGQKSAS